jgi:predicted ATP-binding protein involved in virulence
MKDGTETITTSQTESMNSDAVYWEQRALAAEQRADKVTAVVKGGLTPHLARLMKDQLVWTLLAQRNNMVSAQESGVSMVEELEQRLEGIQTEFESRVELYERRISELEQQLAEKAQINRELIAARIEMTRKALHDVAVRRPDSPFAIRYLAQRAAADAKPRSGREGKLSFRDLLDRKVSGEKP